MAGDGRAQDQYHHVRWVPGLVLPLSEQFKFLPNFRRAFEHLCVHAVLEEVQCRKA